MAKELIIVLALLILFLIGFIYIEPVISKHRIKNKNEYGSARFSSFNEIKNNFTKEKVSSIKEVGVPIWFSRNLKYAWFDKITPHYIYLGSSGSGKSVTSVIPMVSFIANAKKKRSVFITDPKGEIYNATSKMLKNNGYNIITIDFRHPEFSKHINILEPIISEYENYIKYENKSKETNNKKLKMKYHNLSIFSYAETNRLITSLAMMIMDDKGQSKDPFWNNSAKSLLEGLIAFFLEEYKLGNIKRNQITMTSIRKFQNSTMGEVNSRNFQKYINKKPYGVKSKDSLTSIFSASENTYKSIVSVFSEKMAIFDDINVANVTSSSDFDFNVLGKEQTALFVIVPDEDKIYYTLVSIIVGLLYKELVKLANKNESKKLKYEIDWLLDEFANCPPLTDIESIVSVARSRGMRFHFYIQSLSQLVNVYGKEISQIILDNSGLAYLKTNTMDTAEEVSKRLGKKTIEVGSVSQSISLLNFNGNKSISLMARELLTPDEVKNLYHKTIIFPNIGFPIIRDTVLYNKFSCYSSGSVIRKEKSLRDLSDTYFVVEDINFSNQNDNKTIFYDEFKKYDKDILDEIIPIVKSVIKDKLEVLSYKENNGRIYANMSLCRKLNKNDILKLKAKINKDSFHIEITDEVIEIHIKNILQEIDK